MAALIDEQLSAMNLEYADRVKSHRLRPLAVRQVPDGAWRAFRQSKLGIRSGSIEQYKHPCLTSDLDFAEKLLRLVGTVPAGEPSAHYAETH